MLRRHGLPLNASITGVPAAALIASSIAASGVAHRTGDTVADLTCHTALLTTLPAVLTTLAASTTLSLLTALTLLTALRLLLALLTTPSCLTLSRLPAPLTIGLRTSAEAGHLVAQTR